MPSIHPSDHHPLSKEIFSNRIASSALPMAHCMTTMLHAGQQEEELNDGRLPPAG
jgi:hypothetical protein